MPAASTHVLYAKELMERLPELGSRIDRPNLYCIGSQGPDVMFFSHYSFLPNSLHKLGSMMHTRKTKELLFYLKQYTERHPFLRSYYYGFLAHYALDSTAHPIIIHASQKEEELYGTSSTEAHYRNEGDIDTWAFRRAGKAISDYDVYKDTKLRREETEALAGMLKAVLLDVYGVDIKRKEIIEAIHGVSRITRQLRPTETRYRIVYNAEKLMKWPHSISGMMLLHKHDHGLIVFNEDHEKYDVPGRPGEQDSRSFAEIYEDALNYGERIILDLKPEDIVYDFDGNLITGEDN